jgi:DNA polymerase III alpha subunit
MPKIKSIEYIGKHQTFDLELDHPDHQFYLANGLLTSNSHGISYSYNSYACAWLFYYHPIEWAAAVLENESQGKPIEKQKAISLVKNFGFNVIMPDIQKSTDKWQIVDDKTIIAPLNFIKSVGETAVPYVINSGPYQTVEDLIFNDKIDYRKVNKRVLESLVLCGALDSLIDERFDNKKHFHQVIIEDRPKSKKKLDEKIIEFKGKLDDFTNDEIFLNKSELLGYLDLDLLISKKQQEILEDKNILSISDFDLDENPLCWCYVASFEAKVSGKGNKYILLKVIGASFDQYEILLFGSEVESMMKNKCAIIKIAKDIGFGKFCCYNGEIRWIH